MHWAVEKKYLSVDSNKLETVSFLVQEWSIIPEYAQHLQSRHFYVAHGRKCTVWTSTDGVHVESVALPELECTHKEADIHLATRCTCWTE